AHALLDGNAPGRPRAIEPDPDLARHDLTRSASMTQPSTSPIPGPAAGRALPHESAPLHVAGRAPYLDDLPELAGTLHAALGLSHVAHGHLIHIDVAGLKALPGVVDVLTAADIPGINDCGAVIHDDPILANGKVLYVGQPILVVLSAQREL